MNKRVIPEVAVEAAARGMAILDDHDGCFLEVDAWNAQEEWEREAYPDNYPGSSIEDCAYWLGKARAALEAAAPHIREPHVTDEAFGYAVSAIRGHAEMTTAEAEAAVGDILNALGLA